MLSTTFMGGILLGRAQKQGPRIIDKKLTTPEPANHFLSREIIYSFLYVSFPLLSHSSNEKYI